MQADRPAPRNRNGTGQRNQADNCQYDGGPSPLVRRLRPIAVLIVFERMRGICQPQTNQIHRRKWLRSRHDLRESRKKIERSESHESDAQVFNAYGEQISQSDSLRRHKQPLQAPIEEKAAIEAERKKN